ncbi:MAG: hypothetical protein HC892_09925 [Saprospiraceae bacterium]|nr:hypothetical protein [Saprospiraceae bacterium]
MNKSIFQNQEFNTDLESINAKIKAFIDKYNSYIVGVKSIRIYSNWLFDFYYDKSISPNCDYDFNPILVDHKNKELSYEIQEFSYTQQRFSKKWNQYICGVSHKLINGQHSVSFVF